MAGLSKGFGCFRCLWTRWNFITFQKCLITRSCALVLWTSWEASGVSQTLVWRWWTCRWWWRPGPGISPLPALQEAPVPHASTRAAAKMPLTVSHQQGCFHMAHRRFMMTVLFVAIYCPAGFSPLFISQGSCCTAVNYCKADSLVSRHKFRCWGKKQFVYSYGFLQMWLFIELCVTQVWRCRVVKVVITKIVSWGTSK